MQRLLDFIERVGNKVPHPAVLFLALCAGLIVLSQILAWAGWSATYEVVKPPPAVVEEIDIGGSILPAEVLPGEPADASYEAVTETAEVQSLLTADGVRFLFTSFVQNFMGFTAMGIILIVMIGVGVSEVSGLIASLIRKLVAVSSAGTLTYIIVFLGVISSIASDAGYLVLIPLGAAAFKSVGRHPLAGMAAAFAGVAGGFGVNLLITPTDAVLTEITNEAIGLVDPGGRSTSPPTCTSASARRSCSRSCSRSSRRASSSRGWAPTTPLAPSGEELRDQPDAFEGVTPERDSRGLRWAAIAFLIALGVVLALTLPPGAPLRDPESGQHHRHLAVHGQPHRDHRAAVPGRRPRLRPRRRHDHHQHRGHQRRHQVVGRHGRAAVPLPAHRPVHRLLQLLQHPADRGGEAGRPHREVEHRRPWLLLGAMLITLLVGIIMPQAIAKWALLAPIFIPLFLRLGVEPQTVLAAYRVADSPINIVTPIMAYFPLIVVFASRYDKRSGIGTVIALMLPYFVALTVVVDAVLRRLVPARHPVGPGAPV